MPSELPCVWMSAGILSYRLCDREYECETCPLHLALRGGPPPAAAVPAGNEAVARYLAALGAGCTLHLDRAYGADGMWAAPEPAGTVRIGLDEYTLRLLGPVDGVTLPRVGTWLGHGAPCAWINRGRLQVALRSPVAGEVVGVQEHPALAVPETGDGGAARWLFRVQPHESAQDAPGLYRNEALLGWFLARVRTVHEQLEQVMTAGGGAAVGAVLNDGGMPNPNLEIVLGRDRFEALVGTLFPLQ